MTDLAGYYADRAGEYDTVYAKPERQRDLARLRGMLARLVRGKRVLELAAGTGYWTTVMSGTAAAITATDINDATLAIARTRGCGPAPVAFLRADAYALDEVPGSYDAAFIGFFWSHIPGADIPRFLRGLSARLGPGRTVIVLDNRYVPGSSLPISAVTDGGDTCQQRTLRDGRRYEIVKNFPSRARFAADVTAIATDLTWTTLRFYWLAAFALR